MVCDRLTVLEIFPEFEAQDSKYNYFVPSYSLILGLSWYHCTFSYSKRGECHPHSCKTSMKEIDKIRQRHILENLLWIYKAASQIKQSNDLNVENDKPVLAEWWYLTVQENFYP